ncbi:MAG: hypothetical protein WBD95_22460 [Xanthobacteraceae bacterium]
MFEGEELNRIAGHRDAGTNLPGICGPQGTYAITKLMVALMR